MGRCKECEKKDDVIMNLQDMHVSLLNETKEIAKDLATAMVSFSKAVEALTKIKNRRYGRWQIPR